MRFLTTLLTATALCASMLAIAAHKAGELPELELWTVSTATPDMSTSVEAAADHGPSFDRATLGKLSGEPSHPGPHIGSPDGHQG